MKLPPYMKITIDRANPNKTKLNLIVSIKRWGMPVLIFNAFRQMEGIKWYHWLIYPKICIGAMINGFK